METPVGYFERLLVEHGDSPLALGWTPEGQQERFRVLWEVGIGTANSVLDVGCGLGHFLDYMEHRRGAIRWYTGIDASLPMIEAAARRTGRAGAFWYADALINDLQPADFVVSSGMLNVETGTNLEDMAELLRKCFDACRIGVAVNMLSALAPGKRPDRHYYEPGWLASMAVQLRAPRWTIRHDYRDNDMTVYLYKRRK